MEEDLKITGIDFVTSGTEDREVHVTMSNGELVKIGPCYESYEQYNSYRYIYAITVDVADRVNGWLHGGKEPNVKDLIK